MSKSAMPLSRPKPAVILALLAPFLFFLGWLLSAPTSLYALDHTVGAWFRGTPHTLGAQVVETYSLLGNSYLLVVIAILIGLLSLFRWHSWRGVWLTALTVLGPGLLNPLIKALITRPRPDLALRLVQEAGYSFPSGHSMGSVLFYGALTILMLKAWQPTRRTKPLFILLMGGIVLLIAASRLYLSVHYVSDVCAGLSLGATCLYIGYAYFPIFDHPFSTR